MYLKRIELHGFKSFAHRTTLDFDDGVTCIVGPNGCGKSNIVDAVRWVVGEQRARALRSEKMENVIFNGTSKRKALGMAEVLLTVENTRGVLPTEYAEVTLGRRLYRSGDSEYLLNGVECRLRDIQDLFMDTGMGAGAYSVIELAMVEEILSESAEDRRRLFEEAAGITKYKQRRRQALSRLEGTQHDLTRLRDLTEEIGTQVRSLKRQADRAAQFREMEARRIYLERALLSAEHARLSEMLAGIDAGQQRLADALEADTARVATLEARLEKLSAERVAREAARRRAQEALHAHLAEVRRLEGEVQVVRERKARLEAERARLYAELQEGAARHKAQEHVRVRFEDEKQRAEPRQDAAQRALQQATEARQEAQAALDAARQAVGQARRQEDAAEREAADARRQLDRLQARMEMEAAEAVRLRAAVLEGRSEEEVAATQAARADAEAALQRAEEAVREAERARSQMEESRQALAARRGALESQKGALDAERRLLAGLVASYEGFSGAVQALARHRPGMTTVADVLRADEGWQAALAAILGDWAGCVVVADDAEAEAALALLEAERAGQVLLLVLSRLETPTLPDASSTDAPLLAGYVAPIAPAYTTLRDLLLSSWHTAPSLGEARRQARPGARFVTPEGFWADGQGGLRGGSAGTPPPATARAAQRARLEIVQQEREEVGQRLAGLAEEEQALARSLAALDLSGLRSRQAEAGRVLRQHDTALSHAVAERQAAERQAAERQARLDALAASRQTLEADIEAARQALEAAEALRAQAQGARQEAETDASTLEQSSREVFERYNEAALAHADARNRVETLRADLERTRRTLAEMAEQQARREARHAETGRERDAARTAEAEAQSRLDARAEERQALENAAQQAEDDLLALQAGLSDAEKALREARSQRDARVRESGELAVQRAQVHTRIETLAEDFARLFEEAIEEAEVVVPEGFSAATARDEVQVLRKKVAALGSVNALALESYESEKTRLDFLLAQQRDLEGAETSLLETIGEINTTAAQRFRDTFAEIEASFVRLFKELFGAEARAELRLTDTGDPLESAVEIFAQPGGKRPSALSQLSGGEKTLTAIALLFSIYLVKPSPFCILDEVDAPLDEANVDRYMHLIRRFSDKTQFILVTHNKRTMELADRLYGVTMQEPGVSKTVTVRFEEAASGVE